MEMKLLTAESAQVWEFETVPQVTQLDSSLCFEHFECMSLGFEFRVVFGSLFTNISGRDGVIKATGGTGLQPLFGEISLSSRHSAECSVGII